MALLFIAKIKDAKYSYEWRQPCFAQSVELSLSQPRQETFPAPITNVDTMDLPI